PTTKTTTTTTTTNHKPSVTFGEDAAPERRASSNQRSRSMQTKRENIKRALLRSASVGMLQPSPQMKSTLELISRAAWREVLVTNGLRIMTEVGLTKDFPCLRVSCVLPASP